MSWLRRLFLSHCNSMLACVEKLVSARRVMLLSLHYAKRHYRRNMLCMYWPSVLTLKVCCWIFTVSFFVKVSLGHFSALTVWYCWPDVKEGIQPEKNLASAIPRDGLDLTIITVIHGKPSIFGGILSTFIPPFRSWMSVFHFSLCHFFYWSWCLFFGCKEAVVSRLECIELHLSAGLCLTCWGTSRCSPGSFKWARERNTLSSLASTRCLQHLTSVLPAPRPQDSYFYFPDVCVYTYH